MSRSLTEKEKEMLVSTLELMRTGYHESLGPFTHTGTGETWTLDPTPQDPTPFLNQIDDLMVEEEDHCPEECHDCLRPESRRPCGDIRFLPEAERKELSEGWDNGGSGFPIAENLWREDGLDIIVFAKDGRLTEMEMY